MNLVARLCLFLIEMRSFKVRETCQDGEACTLRCGIAYGLEIANVYANHRFRPIADFRAELYQIRDMAWFRPMQYLSVGVRTFENAGEA